MAKRSATSAAEFESAAHARRVIADLDYVYGASYWFREVGGGKAWKIEYGLRIALLLWDDDILTIDGFIAGWLACHRSQGVNW